MLQSKSSHTIVIILSIILIGIASYSNTFNASFQLDDGHAIVNNPAIKDIRNLQKIWAYDTTRFLTYISFALNYHFGKLNVFGYHLVNLAIHILTSIVVFILAQLIFSQTDIFKKETGGRTQIFAGCAALIFLSHPIQTSAVTYIVQRAALLATLFYVSALTFYALFTTTKRFIFYVLAVLAAFLGIFSKPIIMTLPLSLILYEICFQGEESRSLKKCLYRILPFFIIVLLVPLISILWKYQALSLDRLIDISKETTAYSRKDYFLTQINVLVTYIRLLFLPIHQNFDYDYSLVNSFFTYPTWACAVFLTTLAVLGLKLYKRHALISFSIFWFFVTLSAESSIFPIRDLIFEHRLYLPTIGFSLLISYLLIILVPQRKAAISVVGALILIYAGASFHQNKVWKDPVSLWSHALKKAPNKSRPHIYLGNAYLDRKEYGRAFEHFNRALEINPNSAKTYNNRGLIYLVNGQYKNAIRDFQKAIEHDKRYLDAYSNLGNTYQLLGEFKNAVQAYEKALAIYDKHPPSIKNLAQAYYRFGISLSESKQINEALKAYQKAIKADPDHGSSRNNLAVLYFQLGEHEKAIEQIDEAMSRGYQPNQDFLKLLNSHRQ